MPKTQRFRLVQDDSFHWYAIPADKGEDFEHWVSSFQLDSMDSYAGEDFEQYRLGSHPCFCTFTDLREE